MLMLSLNNYTFILSARAISVKLSSARNMDSCPHPVNHRVTDGGFLCCNVCLVVIGINREEIDDVETPESYVVPEEETTSEEVSLYSSVEEEVDEEVDEETVDEEADVAELVVNDQELEENDDDGGEVADGEAQDDEEVEDKADREEEAVPEIEAESGSQNQKTCEDVFADNVESNDEVDVPERHQEEKESEKKKKIQKGLKGQTGHSMKNHLKILIMRRRRREVKKKRGFLCKIIVNNGLQLYM